MSNFELIKTQYYQMRGTGLDAKSVLTRLRSDIIHLDIRERERLLEQLRIWEISNASSAKRTNGTLPRQPAPATIKPLPIQPTQPISKLVVEDPTPLQFEPPTPDPLKIPCPHCGKSNRKDDVFCYACGQLLTMERGLFDTRNFIDTSDEFHNDEFYGPDFTLALMVKSTQDILKCRPQDNTHETIIGRDGGATMMPDINLAPFRADAHGVSRMHLSLSYSEKHRTISAMDVGSANGTFINGQRLHPEEVRVLRHGDELRLGKLVLIVYFYDRNAESK